MTVAAMTVPARKIRALRIEPDVLVQVLKDMMAGKRMTLLKGLPADAKVVGFWTERRDAAPHFLIALESDAFSALPTGCSYERFDVEFAEEMPEPLDMRLLRKLATDTAEQITRQFLDSPTRAARTDLAGLTVELAKGIHLERRFLTPAFRGMLVRLRNALDAAGYGHESWRHADG